MKDQYTLSHENYNTLQDIGFTFRRHVLILSLLVDLMGGCDGPLDTPEAQRAFKQKVYQATALAETLNFEAHEHYDDFAETLATIPQYHEP